MFTNSCHINKNTKYLRDELEKLGRVYTPNGFSKWYVAIENCKYLYCLMNVLMKVEFTITQVRW